MRTLITIEPLSYREALEFVLRELRPHVEVRIAAEDDLEREVMRFCPDLVVCNSLDQDLRESVTCLVHILLEDAMHASICLNGQVERVYDLKLNDLLAVVDQTKELVSSQDTPSETNE